MISKAFSLLALLSPLTSASVTCEPSYGDVSTDHQTAPDSFKVRFFTDLSAYSSEPIEMEITRSWAPLGVDRFYSLIQDNYYECAAFFRVVPDFVVRMCAV